MLHHLGLAAEGSHSADSRDGGPVPKQTKPEALIGVEKLIHLRPQARVPTRLTPLTLTVTAARLPRYGLSFQHSAEQRRHGSDGRPPRRRPRPQRCRSVARESDRSSDEAQLPPSLVPQIM